jgi:hypothetical protein
MAKRTYEPIAAKNVRENFIILLKLWINGTFTEQRFTVQSNCTVGHLRRILTDLYNPTQSARLILMLRNTKLNRGFDNRLVKTLEGFEPVGIADYALAVHAIFKPGKFDQSLVAINENGISDVHKYLKVISILNRNAKTCAVDARANKSPLDRERFDAPEEPVAKRPKVADFAKCTMDISDTLFELSKSMKNLSHKLVEDSDKSSAAMDTLLRNNMDTCRYLAPLLQSLSTISVPVGTGLESELGLNHEPKPLTGEARMITRKAL